ncbi:MAG: helix-turn-helix transcriptional regulator [Opitutaceae bacterium]|nr:helix-turn-helix transcriptional regulator [Cytophagales bacterium]
MKKQAVYFASNLKFLRNRRKVVQEILANALELSRSKIAAYESGQTKNPGMEELISMSRYFKISIDLLLQEDLSKYSEYKLMEIETSMAYAQGKGLKIIIFS